jgi:hypothetical protein
LTVVYVGWTSSSRSTLAAMAAYWLQVFRPAAVHRSGSASIGCSWPDGAAYDAQAAKLAGMFRDNFAAFAGQVPAEVVAAGPRG